MDRIQVMELVHALQTGAMNRREFVQRVTVAIGSASAATTLLAACAQGPTAARPVLDESMVQPSPDGNEDAGPVGGVSAETVSYPGADEGQTLSGYLVRPEGVGPLPAIVVIQEWWGLDEHIRDVTRRFANEGFVALAPDLYHGQVVTEPNEARKLVMELDMEAAIGEIQQAINFLLGHESVSGNTVGIVGFCMGGGLALQTARVEENLGAAVAFYGSPLTAEAAQEVKAPVLGLFGEADGGIPVAKVRAMEEALNEAGVETQVQVYDGAGHAFFNDTRASYNLDAATDSWNRTLAWFRSHLR
jgi:carboxymethylenebutenolidase